MARSAYVGEEIRKWDGGNGFPFSASFTPPPQEQIGIHARYTQDSGGRRKREMRLDPASSLIALSSIPTQTKFCSISLYRRQLRTLHRRDLDGVQVSSTIASPPSIPAMLRRPPSIREGGKDIYDRWGEGSLPLSTLSLSDGHDEQGDPGDKTRTELPDGESDGIGEEPRPPLLVSGLAYRRNRFVTALASHWKDHSL
ncbi:unnamed protein product [Darwinula stevensoni]|uniref:Uncharacterized protein n=1 Tax=Darwinula stevensoni TaxID=69355 RepID=A0A7R8X2T4_9CRUS|nr:unnamed protein product [Darwinula stevensoni]CAG0883682.1 unnamed protein product [Darwinula stevensoni]